MLILRRRLAYLSYESANDKIQNINNNTNSMKIFSYKFILTRAQSRACLRNWALVKVIYKFSVTLTRAQPRLDDWALVGVKFSVSMCCNVSLTD